MRTIKFRGIDCEGNFVYGDLIHKRHCKETVLIQDEKGLGSDVDISTVGQFAELYDKHDDEIYDGDILLIKIQPYSKSIKTAGNLPNPYYVKCQCVYIIDEARFAYKNLNPKSKKNSRNWMHKPMSSMEIISAEIIGNIYKNPELLGNEKEE